MSTGSSKLPVHIEVEIDCNSRRKKNDIGESIREKLSSMQVFTNGKIDILEDDVLNIKCDIGTNQTVSFWQADICLYIYKLNSNDCEKDFLDSNDDDGNLPACEQWELPNYHLQGLWDSIVIDESIKQRLLGYCGSSIQFADAKIDSNIISWNRLVLLHGPPGTGKTTLSKALAQKIFIRNSDRYSSGVLMEINSHSLFSKWFSESGKLVQKLFEHIAEIASDEDCFVCILIDEVESITSTRTSSSSEPGDAVRVVNSVLTALDSLRRRPNILVLTTSNILDSIDPAFKDRIDLKIYLGLPILKARYNILLSCLIELMSKGMISPALSFEQSFEDLQHDYKNNSWSDICTIPIIHQLYYVATITDGMSGRSLRKLPMTAHAFFIQRPIVTIQNYIIALVNTIKTNTHTTNEIEN